MIERIKELCRINKISFSALEKQLGFANGSLAKTDEKTQCVRIKAIAEYFNVSIEYLVYGHEYEGFSMLHSEINLVRAYRAASDSRKEAVRVLLDIREKENEEQAQEPFYA